LTAANVNVQPFWPKLYARVLGGKDHQAVEDIIFGAGGSGAAVVAAGALHSIKNPPFPIPFSDSTTPFRLSLITDTVSPQPPLLLLLPPLPPLLPPPPLPLPPPRRRRRKRMRKTRTW